MSSISSVAGVSSSFMREPSYRNLARRINTSDNTEEIEAQCVSISNHVPNAAYFLSDLVGVRALELAQFGATLDFEENLFAIGSHDLIAIVGLL